ncbi:ATP-dependent Clp protease adapter ClpS [Halorhodospira halochloris]|uniref:ATP-dependent Clp protease adapter protein ClpS n=1 Tax=Halorhodospira halochloris TaxID=1052 RepID=A0A0X8X9G2_HALHR|nr:ATP-dependent Clp protease adapter ClpS [Halorhodospira halochloris]MBK1651237.1 ATP-dependent Clp protease adapter ClpS [Halorhodospira halochloris]MCG5530444.1 ATP-dependent Clp protease adapter ClpS [Halorhodospira halochloris]MCG5548570.1 ATP-dependent Clp protease adapter ClpS [Halorhodospira halochloris]BAU57512.2 ATP-dependent Clp protease adaptor protein ClpS [Halorhodospira halochloris]
MTEEPHQDEPQGPDVEATRPQAKSPPLYRVVLLNDDFTPMDFVVEVLQRFFQMDRNQATQVMLHVHTRGKGVCGVYSRDVAETKVSQVNDYAREHEHPLLCTMEEA